MVVAWARAGDGAKAESRNRTEKSNGTSLRRLEIGALKKLGGKRINDLSVSGRSG